MDPTDNVENHSHEVDAVNDDSDPDSSPGQEAVSSPDMLRFSPNISCNISVITFTFTKNGAVLV